MTVQMRSQTRAPQAIIALLEQGLQMTRMRDASFPRPGRFTGDDEYTEEVREATRTYRQSWVENPLALVLAYLKGEIDARQAEYYYGADPLSSRDRLDDDIRNTLALLGIEQKES